MVSKQSVKDETGITVKGQVLDGSVCPSEAEGGHGREMTRSNVLAGPPTWGP